MPRSRTPAARRAHILTALHQAPRTAHELQALLRVGRGTLEQHLEPLRRGGAVAYDAPRGRFLIGVLDVPDLFDLQQQAAA